MWTLQIDTQGLNPAFSLKCAHLGNLGFPGALKQIQLHSKRKGPLTSLPLSITNVKYIHVCSSQTAVELGAWDLPWLSSSSLIAYFYQSVPAFDGFWEVVASRVVVIVHLVNLVQLFVSLWTIACQAPLSSTVSRSFLKFMSIESVILSSHLIPSPPSPPAFSLSQHQGLFRWVSSSYQVAKILELQHQPFQWLFRVDFL